MSINQFMVMVRPVFITISALLLLFAVAGDIHAQTSNSVTPVDNLTPLALQQGSPVGSYALSGFDNVNLYNGNLNFHLPLMQIGGRGGAGYTMYWGFDAKSWYVHRTSITDSGGEETNIVFMPVRTPWQPIDVGYTPGVMYGKQTGVGQNFVHTGFCTHNSFYNYTVTRLTLILPDRTEIELHDQLNNGQPEAVPSNICTTGNPNGADRGKVFVTGDTTAMTFIFDNGIADRNQVNTGPTSGGWNFLPSGYLFTKDGTRYRFDSGNVTWMEDRNGNRITFGIVNGAYTITDSVNRVVTVEPNVTDPTYGNCDRITYTGFDGNPRHIFLTRTSLGNALRSDYTIQTLSQLFSDLPGIGNVQPQTFNPSPVISGVYLPDGRSYRLFYNSYYELARVELPTGGAIEYDMTPGSGVVSGGGCSEGTEYQLYRRVIARRILPDGTNVEQKTLYSSNNGASNVVTVDHVDPNNSDPLTALLSRELHYFNGDPVNSLFGGGLFTLWSDGREFKTEYLAGDGSVLRRTEETIQQRVPVSWWSWWASQSINTICSGVYGGEPARDPITVETTSTLVDTNQVSKTSAINPNDGTLGFDQYSNQTDVWEYDFGSGSPGSLVRHSHTSYLTTSGGINYDTVNPSTTNPLASSTYHLRSLPTQTSVYNASGVEQARTTFEYDNYASNSTHAALVNQSGISGLDSLFITSYTPRGNATAVTHYLLSGGSVTGSISNYAQYDIAGNTVRAIDALGNATTIDYSDRFGSPDTEAISNTSPTELSSVGQTSYAFATSVTNALGHTAYSQFNYYTGKPVNGQDANGVVSAAYFNDVLDRPTQIIRGANQSAPFKSQTTFTYDDTNHIITTTSDLATYNDNVLKGQSLYDGLGRTTETRNYETSTTYITAKVFFDALGRTHLATNPYRSVSANTDGWTRTNYDALGRVIEVATFSGSVGTVPPDTGTNSNWTGSVSSGYSGNTVTVADQAGNARKSVTDGLGRLTSVYEDPSGLNYQTNYSYDVLNSLTSVSQGAQTRTFAYDSLNRLTSATNPESGTVAYIYDNNGNLTNKTDSIGNISTMVYDAINRVTSKSYSVVSPTADTPTVNYIYDAQSLPTGAPSGFDRGYSTGRLVAVTYGGSGTSAGTYYGYDPNGRTLRIQQQTDGNNYKVGATYNLAGAMTSETYPAVPSATDRRTVTNTYDNAGRLASVQSPRTSYAGGAGVGSITYTASGALASESYSTSAYNNTQGAGSNIDHAITYNSRQQPTEIMLGQGKASRGYLDLSYDYGSTNNNGNILSTTNSMVTGKQFYGYDSLNRLTSVQEAGATGSPIYWQQTLSYDQYGNRTAMTADAALGTYTPAPAIDSSNNRFVTTGGSYGYDATGNVSWEPTSYGSLTYKYYTYDAENHLTNAKQGASLGTATDTGNYVYDGEGRRVKKTTQDNLLMVYGISGRLVAEFDTTSTPYPINKEYIYGVNGLLATLERGSPTDMGKIKYTTADHLGSPRVINLGTNQVQSRHDYLPFGEEIPVGVNGRTVANGYSGSDGERQKFTSKERDTETGLDYFNARYYSSAQGRFTSADPVDFTKYRIVSPQAWNKYSYVMNTPLKFMDPSGKVIQFKNEEDAKRGLALYQAGLQKDQQSALSIGKDKKGHFILKVDAKMAEKAGGDSLLGRLNKAATTERVGVVDFVKKDTEFTVIRFGVKSAQETTTFAKEEAKSSTIVPGTLTGLTLFEFGDKDHKLFNTSVANSAEEGVSRILINTDSHAFTPSEAIYAETLAHFQNFAETGDARKAIHPRVDADEKQIVEQVGANEKKKP